MTQTIAACLPCKVGDTVYMINNGEIREFYAHRFHIYSHTTSVLLKLLDSSVVSYEEVSCKDFGRIAFLTRFEAEKSLKERIVV